MSAPEGADGRQLELPVSANAPGAPQEVAQGCLCSPLLNAHGTGLRETPGAEPMPLAWLVDPLCPRHVRA